MMKINERIAAITPSASLTITSHAKSMVAEGRTVYNFAAGEPDFDTPRNIKEAAVDALMKGATKYTPVPGLPALVEAISRKLSRENGLDYKPAQIVVSNGAKHSLFNLFCAICCSGDEVVIPAPYWLSYPEMVNVAGGTCVYVETKAVDGYKMTADALRTAITPRTKAVIFNSPSNPVGCVYSRDELCEIVEVLREHPHCLIVADEIYEKMLYDGAEHVSIGSLGEDILERTVTVNGFSKSYAMTGWRLGYLAAPLSIAKAVGALQSHSTSAPNTFAQHGAIEAFSPQTNPAVDAMVAAFDERRSVMFEMLSDIPGITCAKPLGAFYMLPDISSFGLGSVAFCERLLDEAGIAAVPGICFGADRTVRFSYACDMQTIREGVASLKRLVTAL